MKKFANKEEIETIEKTLKLAIKSGAVLTIITRKNIIGACFGWILTKNNNLLYVQNEYFGGVSFSFQYKPNKKTGSGCSAGNDSLTFQEINFNEIEESGLNFARRLKATLFTKEEIKNKIEKLLEDEDNEIFIKKCLEV